MHQFPGQTDKFDFFYLTNFAQEGNFRSKKEKSHLRVRPWWLLIILNFSTPGATDTTLF